MPHFIYIIFFFALGACIGSFLNVVVWRLPQIEIPPDAGLMREFFLSFKGLSHPPSHCPKCNNLLKWYDNIPIFGWIKLKGKCRFCKQPFSVRYAVVELITGLIFVGYYVAYFMLQVRTCCPHARVISMSTDMFGNPHEITNPMWVMGEAWPIFLLYLFLLAGLLAASLIDAELFIIPLSIPWSMAIVGFIVHTFADHPAIPGSLNLVGEVGCAEAAIAIGATIGLLISIVLWNLKILPTSFPQGEPMELDREQYQKELEQARRAGEKVDHLQLPPEYTPWQIRLEISKEMLFLLPPMILGATCMAGNTWWPAFHNQIQNQVMNTTWLNALLGSFFGAMIGAFVVWITRILGTLGFRRVAMGLGDVHLMFGVGAIIGAAGAAEAFFIAPAFGILTAVYRLIMRKSHEVPFGPYLAMGTAAVMLLYCPIQAYLAPGFAGLLMVLGNLIHTGKMMP